MPANMSLKAFAPKIASPDTTPLYSSIRLSWRVLVVVSSTPYLPSDHVPDRTGSYLAHPKRDRRRVRSVDHPTASSSSRRGARADGVTDAPTGVADTRNRPLLLVARARKPWTWQLGLTHATGGTSGHAAAVQPRLGCWDGATGQPDHIGSRRREPRPEVL